MPASNATVPPQVVHCRRVLKWTYAIAYYTFEETVGGVSADDATAAPAWQVACNVPAALALLILGRSVAHVCGKGR